MLWAALVTILLVGGVYYVIVQRTKPAHMQAPEGELVDTRVQPGARQVPGNAKIGRMAMVRP